MKLRIGTRGSALAMAQAQWVASELRAKDASLSIEILPMSTQGDRDANASLTAIGGKGVFVKEIEEALLRKEIDLAVHSLKDLPQELPSGLVLGPYPARQDARDAFVSRFGEQLAELPRGSTIGTSSPRRKAQIIHRHEKRQFRIEPIRGNVETRIKKLKDGQFDAIVLAFAGLKRLGLEGEATQVLEPADMMPAPGQGALGLELRLDDKPTLELITKISERVSDITARAERAFLQGLGGSCLLPVGAWSRANGDHLMMEAMLLDPSGTQVVKAAQDGPASAPELVGAQLAERLLYDGGSEIMALAEKAAAS